MRYANILQVTAALLLVLVCFMPWVYIESIDKTVTGMNASVPNFGRPGIMNIFFTIVSVILFFMPSIWARRINVFICAFNFSWSIRNFLLTTQCEMGECPEKKWGIFALLLLSLVLLVLSFFPQMKSVK